jgi:hypothetical protein
MAKSDSNGNPLRKSRGLAGKLGSVADWAKATPDLVVRAITTAATTGGALRFGYTSDGGAYALGIYGDGAPYTHYVNPAQDIDITLNDVIDLFEGIADELAKAQAAKKDG